MTPEERQLITGLFDRMRGFALAGKDGEAEALINEGMRSVQNAPYMLVQSVLVQEHALQQAEGRISELEEQVRALQSAAQPPPAGGSFLGGLFGGRPAAEPARGPTSVPAIGSRATPSVEDGRPGWMSPQASPQPGMQPGQPAQPASGGFLRSAMTTAAGVAGGMLAAGAISNMLGGSAHATPAATPTPTPAAGAGGTTETTQPGNAQDDRVQEARHEADDDDDNDDGWFGGDDDGELDI